jgi:hypothetical protein
LHRETAEQKANHIIAQEMSRLGWTEVELSSRLKNDSDKLAMPARVRKETTLPIKWIAARLQMGASKSLKPMRLHWRHGHENANGSARCAQLQFQPLTRMALR